MTNPFIFWQKSFCDTNLLLHICNCCIKLLFCFVKLFISFSIFLLFSSFFFNFSNKKFKILSLESEDISPFFTMSWYLSNFLSSSKPSISSKINLSSNEFLVLVLLIVPIFLSVKILFLLFSLSSSILILRRISCISFNDLPL